MYNFCKKKTIYICATNNLTVSYVCVVFVQGRCPLCTVPRDLLDDIDSDFQAKDKFSMLQKVKDGLKGIYDGWEDDIVGPSIGPKKPRSLLKKDGTLAITRKRKIATKLGRHMLVTFFDDMEFVDLHSMVFLTCIKLHCILEFCCMCTDCVLTLCSQDWIQCIQLIWEFGFI